MRAAAAREERAARGDAIVAWHRVVGRDERWEAGAAPAAWGVSMEAAAWGSAGAWHAEVVGRRRLFEWGDVVVEAPLTTRKFTATGGSSAGGDGGLPDGGGGDGGGAAEVERHGGGCMGGGIAGRAAPADDSVLRQPGGWRRRGVGGGEGDAAAPADVLDSTRMQMPTSLSPALRACFRQRTPIAPARQRTARRRWRRVGGDAVGRRARRERRRVGTKKTSKWPRYNVPGGGRCAAASSQVSRRRGKAVGD